MKNRSIRFKLTLWFSLILIVIAGIILFALRYASGTVLRHTVRDYLIGTVEENVAQIDYVDEKGDNPSYFFIPYDKGYLEIDEDFMDVVNDVYTALYSQDGTLLYGENPVALKSENLPFTSSHTWYEKIDGIRYDFYDRKVVLPNLKGQELWIRGVVPETRNVAQLAEITRIILVALPLLLALSILSGYLLAGGMLSPIRKMEETAQEISEGTDLKARLEVKTGDEIGKLGGVFNGMLERLDKSFESERQFTSDASHELRTPLSVIKAQCEYTLEKDRSPEDYREALETIYNQSVRMDDLVSDMLDYTRMDRGIERYPLSAQNLSELVSQVSEEMSLLKTRGITLISEVEKGISVEGNQLLLTRMLQNLISNAYRYGRDQGFIRVSLSVSEGSALLSVKDDGIGISPEEQEKIFDRFYRSDSSRSVKGTGLGLSMVKRIAELHGADLSLESTVGEGSIFSIRFKTL